MTPAQYNFTVRQGDTFDDAWAVADETGTSVNLSGCTARMFLRATADAASTLLEATTANGRIVLAGGTITFNVSATLTAALPVGTAVYDLEVTSATGVVSTWAYGTITVVRKVTR